MGLCLLTFYILKKCTHQQMFDRFRKKKEEFKSTVNTDQNQISDTKTFEFQPQETVEPENNSAIVEESRFYPSEQVKILEHIQQTSMGTASEDIGIKALMDKRTKLEEAIDYVGLMIKNLKDKRTGLEKNIEDESVDIKNLKEKLVKVSQYIEEEKQGIKSLQQKRGQVEKEADDVANIINDLREKLVSIDHVVNEEGSKIAKFKETRTKTESSL